MGALRKACSSYKRLQYECHRNQQPDDNATTSTATTTTAMFGSTATNPTAFGDNQPSTTVGSGAPMFGSASVSATDAQQTTSSLFGSSQAPPAFSFGSPAVANPFRSPVKGSGVFGCLRPIQYLPQPINYCVSTVHDQDYGQCMQFDLVCTKFDPFVGSPNATSFKEDLTLSFTLPTSYEDCPSAAQFNWLLKLEVIKSGDEVTVRCFLCNPEERRNAATFKFIMCIVHNSVSCSCEDKQSHRINYADVPTGSGHGFEWRYSFNKFRSIFINGQRFSTRLKILEAGHLDNVSNWQVIKNYGNSTESNKPGSIFANYKNMINDASTADFRIEFEDDRAILVHKLILTFQWPYFKRLLQSNAIDATSDRMKVTGHGYDTILSLVTYLYAGALDIQNVEHAFNLYKASHSSAFELESIQELARSYLAHHLSIEHLLEVLIAADQAGYADLKEICKRKLAEYKGANRKIKLESYPGYAKFRSYEHFQQLISELLTHLFNESS